MYHIDRTGCQGLHPSQPYIFYTNLMLPRAQFFSRLGKKFPMNVFFLVYNWYIQYSWYFAAKGSRGVPPPPLVICQTQHGLRYHIPSERFRRQYLDRALLWSCYSCCYYSQHCDCLESLGYEFTRRLRRIPVLPLTLVHPQQRLEQVFALLTGLQHTTCNGLCHRGYSSVHLRMDARAAEGPREQAPVVGHIPGDSYRRCSHVDIRLDPDFVG